MLYLLLLLSIFILIETTRIVLIYMHILHLVHEWHALIMVTIVCHVLLRILQKKPHFYL